MEMMNQGLAAQSVDQAQGAQPSQDQILELVSQIAELLKQGVSPKELLDKGVPENLIDMALQMLGQDDVDVGVDDQDDTSMPESMEYQQPQGLAAQLS